MMTTTATRTAINDGSSDADVHAVGEGRRVHCPVPCPPSASFERVVVGGFGGVSTHDDDADEGDGHGADDDDGGSNYGDGFDGGMMMMMDSVELPPPPSWFLSGGGVGGGGGNGGVVEDPLLDALDAVPGGEGEDNDDDEDDDDDSREEAKGGEHRRRRDEEREQLPWRTYLPLAARELTNASLSRASRYARLSYVTVATSGFYSSTGGVTSDLNTAGGYSVGTTTAGLGMVGDGDENGGGCGGGGGGGDAPILETVLLEEDHPDAAGDGESVGWGGGGGDDRTGLTKGDGRRPPLQQQKQQRQQQQRELPHFSSLPWLDRQLVPEWRTVSEEDARYLTEAQNELIRRRTAHRGGGGNNRGRVDDVKDAHHVAAVTAASSPSPTSPSTNAKIGADDDSVSDGKQQRSAARDRRQRLEPLDEDPSVLSSSASSEDNDDSDLDLDLLDDESITKARSVVPPPLPRPVWDHSSNCHSCLRTFSPTLLRHHCRACGRSACSAHSSRTHRLPHFGYHPLVAERVCDSCKSIFSKRDLAERVAWRLARARDYLSGDLTPYFATGVDTIQDAALRFTHWTLHLTRRMPLGAQATVAVETVEVLRKHGLNCVFGFLLRNEFLQAAEMLARVAGVDAKTWPLSVHELSAAIFYALVEHKSARGLDPEGEHRMHRLGDDHHDELEEVEEEEEEEEEEKEREEEREVEAEGEMDVVDDGGGVCVVEGFAAEDEDEAAVAEVGVGIGGGGNGDFHPSPPCPAGVADGDVAPMTAEEVSGKDTDNVFDVAAEWGRRTGEHATAKLLQSSSSSSVEVGAEVSAASSPSPPQQVATDGGSDGDDDGGIAPTPAAAAPPSTSGDETVEDLLAMADDAIRRGPGAAVPGDGNGTGDDHSAEADETRRSDVDAPPQFNPGRGNPADDRTGRRRGGGKSGGGGVCSPVSDSLLQSLLFYAPLALHFIYADNEIEMQLLAAQQGWSLLYAHLNQFDDTHSHHHQRSPSSSSPVASEAGGGGGGGIVTDRPAYALFAHRQHKVACFAIRGTATMNDVVTDIRAIPVPFPFMEEEEEARHSRRKTDGHGHEYREEDVNKDDADEDDDASWTAVPRPRGMALCGMARAAQNLFRENLDILLHLARKGYRIRIVGHSLGGGVAALLGILVRRHIMEEEGRRSASVPSAATDTSGEGDRGSSLNADDDARGSGRGGRGDRLRVYGYGTPACVDSKLAKMVCPSEGNDDGEDFVTTVVCHDDVVPRLTPTSVRGLLKHLLRVRETWVRDHLVNDVFAVAARVGRGWAPRWRGSFMLRGGGGGGRMKAGTGNARGGDTDDVGTTRCPHCGYDDSIGLGIGDGAAAVGLHIGGGEDAALCPKCGRGLIQTAVDGDHCIGDAVVEEEESLIESSSDDDDDDDDDDFFSDYGFSTMGRRGVPSSSLDENNRRRRGTNKSANIGGPGKTADDDEAEDWVPFDEPPLALASRRSREDTDAVDGGDTTIGGNPPTSGIAAAETEDTDDVRSGSPVVLEESPLPRMYLPGKIVHIYTHRGAFKATYVPRTFRELRRISLAGNMLGDHTTKSYYESMLEVRSVRRAGMELPRWTGFGEGVTCSCCASRFSWASTSDSEAQEARDKHNCRSCGCLVCHPCSRNRVALPHIGITVPVRVCDRCYHDLGTGLGGSGEYDGATMTRSYLDAAAEL